MQLYGISMVPAAALLANFIFYMHSLAVVSYYNKNSHLTARSITACSIPAAHLAAGPS